MLDSPRSPEVNEQVYVVDYYDDHPVVVEGIVSRFNGPSIMVEEPTYDGLRRLAREHRTNVFTITDVAEEAKELLPQPKVGHERLLKDAVLEVLNDVSKNKELAVRLGTLSMIRRLEQTPNKMHLGFKSIEEILGSASEPGSNIWLIEDLIELSEQKRNAVQVLALAHAEEEEFSKLSPENALSARGELQELNRSALNALYERYEVDYADADVYEYLTPDGSRGRVTIYPSDSDDIYFVERVLVEDGLTPEFIEVATKAPELSSKPGYRQIV